MTDNTYTDKPAGPMSLELLHELQAMLKESKAAERDAMKRFAATMAVSVATVEAMIATVKDACSAVDEFNQAMEALSRQEENNAKFLGRGKTNMQARHPGGAGLPPLRTVPARSEGKRFYRARR